MALRKSKQNKGDSDAPGYTGFKFMYKRKGSDDEIEIQWPPTEILKKRSKIFNKIQRKNKILKIVLIIALAWFLGYGFTNFLKGLL